MREDLIERLRKLIDDRCGDGPSGPNYDPELLDVLTEAAAALEAAREDADKVISQSERYANEKERDPIDVPSSRLCIWASDPRAAIDQARGKGGAQ